MTFPVLFHTRANQGRSAPTPPPASNPDAVLYGLRNLWDGYDGALVRLRRNSDNAESDFSATSTALDAPLDTSAIATWLGAASGYLVTWYDQGDGGFDASQATSAAQPLYVANAQNGKPGLRFDGTNDNLRIPDVSRETSQLSVFAVVSRLTSSGAEALLSIEDASSGNWYIQLDVVNPANGSLFSFSCNYTGSLSENNLVDLLNATALERASVLYGEVEEQGNLNAGVDGVLNGSPTAFAHSFSSLTGGVGYIGANGALSNFCAADIHEVRVYLVLFDDPTRTFIEADINAYWDVWVTPSDTFTNSNGVQLATHSANWTVNNGDFDIQTNSLAPDASAVECVAFWNHFNFKTAQYARATIAAVSSSSESIGLAVRVDVGGADTYYGYYFDVNNWYLFKSVAGVWTQLDTGAVGDETDVGVEIQLQVSGTTVSVYYNTGSGDNLLTSVTDSAVTRGAAGVSGYSDNTSNRIDGWTGGNL